MFSRTANLNQYRPGTPTVPLVHVWRTALLLAAMLLLSNWSWSATTISATRVWPAQDYTRITLESAAPLQFQLLALKNPDRLALDIDGINVNAALEELSNKIGGNDPYVKSVRVGRFKQGTVRLVFDLKADVKPEVFTLRPVAEYLAGPVHRPIDYTARKKPGSTCRYRGSRRDRRTDHSEHKQSPRGTAGA